MNISLTISRVAKQLQINVETIRYYERRGLIDQPEKPAEGYRIYPEETLRRIQFIKRAKELGFKLGEITHLLSLGKSQCEDVQVIAEGKLESVKAKIFDLVKLKTVLNDLIVQCQTNPDQSSCPIVEALLPGDEESA